MNVFSSELGDFHFNVVVVTKENVDVADANFTLVVVRLDVFNYLLRGRP